MKKSKTQVLSSMAILLPPLFLFTMLTDLPHVLVITLLGYGFSLMQRKPFTLSDRSVIYTGVLIAVVVGIMDLLFPLNHDRFGYITMIFRTEYYAVGLFYLAVAVTFFSSGRAMIGTATAVSIYSLISSGDVFNLTVDNVRLPLFSAMINRHFTTLYATAMIVSLTIALFFLRRDQLRNIAQKSRIMISKRLIHIALIVFLPLILFGTYKLYRAYEDDLRRLENHLIRIGVRQRMLQRSGWTVFGREANLRNIMSQEMFANQQQIIIRASAKQAPGYLRGHAYEVYQNGIWSEPTAAQTTELQSQSYSGMLTAKSFYLFEPQTQYKYQCQLLQEAKFISDVLLIPGNTQRIDLIAERVTVTAGGSAAVIDWQKDGGYSVFSEEAQTTAYPLPAEPKPTEFLQIPADLNADLDSVIDLIPGLRDAKNDAERFQRLLEYFKTQFSYSLDWQGSKNDDPVTFFLCNAKRGHCELYAAAMTLLLRRLEIPARYVTGFICAEPHPSGRYFVARLGNAHAWLEAYDRQQKRWIHLEPTPSSEIDTIRGEWNTFSRWNDAFKQWRRELLANLRRGLFAKAITDVAIALWSLLWNPIGGIITVAMILLWWFKRKRKRKNASHYLNISAIKIQLGQIYRRRIRVWEKHAEITASPSRTSSEILELFKNSGKFTEPELQEIEQFITRWQHLRFSTKVITPEVVKKELEMDNTNGKF